MPHALKTVSGERRIDDIVCHPGRSEGSALPGQQIPRCARDDNGFRFPIPHSPFPALPVRIISFNANGVRSAAPKGFFDWFAAQDADLLCMQETKAQEHQLAGPDGVHADFVPPGYKAWFRDATTKKGYSGVAIYSRDEPDEVRTALGRESFDEEGRYIEARFGNLSVVSFYIPSGSSGELRQGFKFEAMDWLGPILDQWLASGRDYVLCGDWNIVRS